MTIDDALAWLEAIFTPFGSDAGYGDAVLDAAEQRLGVALPSSLRTIYRRSGRVRALHAAHNQLLPPDAIHFASNYLLFYEEKQRAVVWGIRRDALSRDDPPVEQGQLVDGGAWAFHPEFASVTEFACAQGAWQAVQGGLAFVGVLDGYAGPSVESLLGKPSLTTRGMRAWHVRGGVMVEAGNYLGLATQREVDFLAATAQLEIPVAGWDYATLRDDV